MKNKITKNSGFTLIELSMSLIIISFLIAAVVVGSSLINQAKTRGVVTEVRAISTAINSFKMIYGTIPGDFANALSYWPAVAGTVTASMANGNGNGYIDGTEYKNSFQMLSAAGLIQNSVNFSNTNPSKYSNLATYQIYNHAVLSSTAVYGNASLGDVVDFGSISGTTFNGGVKPQDALDIDNKMDDGILYSGIVYTAKGTNKTGANLCTTLATTYASTSATSPAITADSYYLSDNTYSCWMFFWIVDTVN